MRHYPARAITPHEVTLVVRDNGIGLGERTRARAGEGLPICGPALRA
jgi:hypothetical protein